MLVDIILALNCVFFGKKKERTCTNKLKRTFILIARIILTLILPKYKEL